ncbi:hypothetical protein LG3211_0973 [Lysobacter gummosus]|nr:hypothetical protein LG3211_0973 [Lysobacter gummosus]
MNGRALPHKAAARTVAAGTDRGGAAIAGSMNGGLERHPGPGEHAPSRDCDRMSLAHGGFVASGT